MNNALLSCVLKKDIKTLRDILDKNTNDISADDMLYASLHAASTTTRDLVNVFLSKGVHINDILTEAVKHSFRSATDTLIEMGGNVNCEHGGYTLTTLAAIQHDTDCMKKLLQYGAQLNLKTVNGDTCLTCVAQHFNDYTKEVQYLIEKGADVNLSNDKDETPLYVAAKYGNDATLRVLLSLGAEINHQNCYGETALMIASENHASECVLSLLQCGAEKDWQSLSGDTALMKDIKNMFHGEASHAIIDLFLQTGCDMDIPDYEHETPLSVAIQLDERSIISKLLHFGADIFTESSLGITPFIESIITSHDELAAHLINMECYVGRTQQWKQSPPIVEFLARVLTPSFNPLHSTALNKLFFGAGETIPIRDIYQPHVIAIMATETNHKTLMTITRHTIRSYLLSISPVNLIAQITKLPLPTSVKEFLYFS